MSSLVLFGVISQYSTTGDAIKGKFFQIWHVVQTLSFSLPNDLFSARLSRSSSASAWVDDFNLSWYFPLPLPAQHTEER